MTKDLRIEKETGECLLTQFHLNLHFAGFATLTQPHIFSRTSLLLSIVYIQSHQHDIFTGILKANHLMEVMANKQNLTANSHA